MEVTKIKLNEAKSVVFSEALGTSGESFDFSVKDMNTVILLNNTNASSVNVTIKAGDGIQGVNDETVSVAASSIAAIRIESGKFKKDGKITLVPSVAGKVSIAIIEHQ